MTKLLADYRAELPQQFPPGGDWSKDSYWQRLHKKLEEVSFLTTRCHTYHILIESILCSIRQRRTWMRGSNRKQSRTRVKLFRRLQTRSVTRSTTSKTTLFESKWKYAIWTLANYATVIEPRSRSKKKGNVGEHVYLLRFLFLLGFCEVWSSTWRRMLLWSLPTQK